MANGPKSVECPCVFGTKQFTFWALCWEFNLWVFLVLWLVPRDIQFPPVRVRFAHAYTPANKALFRAYINHYQPCFPLIRPKIKTLISYGGPITGRGISSELNFMGKSNGTPPNANHPSIIPDHKALFFWGKVALGGALRFPWYLLQWHLDIGDLKLQSTEDIFALHFFDGLGKLLVFTKKKTSKDDKLI